VSPDSKHQLYQSIGQFCIVFLTGMSVFKGWSDVLQLGIMNAIYEPVVQGLLAAAAIWGLSKTGPAKP
jgi:hypothetical protein